MRWSIVSVPSGSMNKQNTAQEGKVWVVETGGAKISAPLFASSVAGLACSVYRRATRHAPGAGCSPGWISTPSPKGASQEARRTLCPWGEMSDGAATKSRWARRLFPCATIRSLVSYLDISQIGPSRFTAYTCISRG